MTEERKSESPSEERPQQSAEDPSARKVQPETDEHGRARRLEASARADFQRAYLGQPRPPGEGSAEGLDAEIRQKLHELLAGVDLEAVEWKEVHGRLRLSITASQRQPQQSSTTAEPTPT